MPRLTFWFEFASTYSYLAAARIEPLAAQAGVAVAWRPFLLGPIFQAQGWTTSPFNLFPAKGANMWRDMERQTQKYGLPPLARPAEFPQNGLLAARLATMGMAAGWGPAFTRAVYARQFAEGCDISDDNTLRGVLDDIGQDADALMRQAKTDQAIKDLLRGATAEAIALGVYGAPSFTTGDGELFWGNDRLEDALDWTRSH